MKTLVLFLLDVSWVAHSSEPNFLNACKDARGPLESHVDLKGI
jgi:hypothetical protein